MRPSFSLAPIYALLRIKTKCSGYCLKQIIADARQTGNGRGPPAGARLHEPTGYHIHGPQDIIYMNLRESHPRTSMSG